MPGPGQKKKAKPKRSGPANANGGTSFLSSGTGTFVPSDDFLTNVKDAEGWAQVAGALCTGLNLPGEHTFFQLLIPPLSTKLYCPFLINAVITTASGV